MEREKFMQEARLTVHRILEGKENGIMNLVQQAWAEGKRNAEVETLRAAIEEALDKREQKSDSEAVYPTWYDYLHSIGVLYKKHTAGGDVTEIQRGNMMAPIPADMAEKLGLEPKEG